MQNQIPKNWQTTTLGGTATLNYGNGLIEQNRQQGGVPVYGSSGITGYHNQPLVNEPGYIIGRKGSVGSIYFSPQPFFPIDTTYYVTKSDVNCDFNFFNYLLKTLRLNKLNSDSAVPGLNRETAYAQKVLLPTLPEQSTIASILSTFDDKIQVNNKIAKNLEEMAQTIFKEWFVKFKFPGYEKVKMIDSELGKIPEGWKIGKLGKLINLDRGVSYNGAGLTTNGLPMINLGCFLRGGKFTFENLKFYSGRHTQNHLVKEGDIVIANTDITQNREIIGNPAIVNEFHQYKSFLFTHHVFAMRNNSEYSNYFFYFLLRTPSFRNRAAGFATGTNVLALPKDALLELQIVLAPLKIASMFSEMATGVVKVRTCCESENQKLAEMRDLLLPKLMKGEIRV